MYEDVVKAARIFATIDPAAAAELIAVMHELDFSKGDVVFNEGDVGNRMYVIAEGKVKVGQRSHDGRENLLAVLGKSEVLGELALFDPGPRTATATAVIDTVLYELRHEDFLSWLRLHPGASPGIISGLALRLRRADEVIADLVFSDVPGRIAKTLLDMASRFGETVNDGIRVSHDLTQEELAHLVGASRETVNKALADFTTRGWIRRDGRALVILKAGRLKKRSR